MIRMAAQKNFHKIFTFELVRRFFQGPVGALPISDYAHARFFAQRKRVTLEKTTIFSKSVFKAMYRTHSSS
jgi:hypothetical protein